jgi:hypothetical protein
MKILWAGMFALTLFGEVQSWTVVSRLASLSDDASPTVMASEDKKKEKKEKKKKGGEEEEEELHAGARVTV